MQCPTEGPYKVLKVNTNGTLCIRRGNYDKTIHVRRLKPFVHRAKNLTKKIKIKFMRLGDLGRVVAGKASTPRDSNVKTNKNNNDKKKGDETKTHEAAYPKAKM